MNQKKKCAICATRFEAKRSDAKYCSNACKQKAYAKREGGALQNKEKEIIFYFDEYQYTCQEFGYDSESLPFIVFCFLRIGFPATAQKERSAEYINSFWDDDRNLGFTRTKAYRIFKEEFLNRKYTVLESRDDQNTENI